jgi:hypothetical protein
VNVVLWQGTHHKFSFVVEYIATIRVYGDIFPCSAFNLLPKSSLSEHDDAGIAYNDKSKEAEGE